MIDFLILYEVKQRELENIILIGNELKRRGYSVGYISFYQIDSKENIDKYYGKVKVVITPSLYHNEELMNIIYRVAGKVMKIINLQWEQVGTLKAESDKASYLYPKELAKYAKHVCWGEKPANNLVLSGVPQGNILITGPVHIDFLRQQFSDYYIRKDTLFKKYNINPKQRTILFISSFVYSNMTERELYETSKAWGTEWVNKQREIAVASFDQLCEWFDAFLRINKDINFIYRPHPVENGNIRLIEMQKKHKNFHVISEFSVKQWILNCEIIQTWISTSIAEAYYAGKKCTVLRPVPIPKQQEMSILINSDQVRTFEEYVNSINYETTNSLIKNTIEGYYDVCKTIPSFVRLCDKLEEILYNDKDKFPWDENIIKEFNSKKSGRNVYRIIKYIYVNILSTCMVIQERTKINFGELMNSRIDNYRKSRKKILNNIASEEELQQISIKIKNIILREFSHE